MGTPGIGKQANRHRTMHHMTCEVPSSHMHRSPPLGHFLALWQVVGPLLCLLLGPFLPPSQVSSHWIRWPHLEPCRRGGRRMLLRRYGPRRRRSYGARIYRKNKRTRFKKIRKVTPGSMVCPHNALERNSLPPLPAA